MSGHSDKLVITGAQPSLHSLLPVRLNAAGKTPLQKVMRRCKFESRNNTALLSVSKPFKGCCGGVVPGHTPQTVNTAPGCGVKLISMNIAHPAYCANSCCVTDGLLPACHNSLSPSQKPSKNPPTADRPCSSSTQHRKHNSVRWQQKAVITRPCFLVLSPQAVHWLL